MSGIVIILVVMNGQNYRNYFRDKRITLMGLGLLGRGVGDAKFLAEFVAQLPRAGLVPVQAPPLVITDLKSAKELAPSLMKLKKLQAISYVLGEHRLKDFRNRDLIIKAAGVPLDSPFIAEARRQGIPIEMSTALFAKLSGAKIIGVTGTRGKTTVTSLIYEILKHCCQCQGLSLTVRKVWLGGNIHGISTLALLPKVRPGDLVVLELDSWQLQGFGEDKLSPHISVFTNFYPDHLNYYHGDMGRYFEDKANIYKYQQKEDVVFAGKEISQKIKTSGRKIIPPALPTGWKLNLLGKHNRINASLAVAVARELTVPDKVIKKVLAKFSGVPGRLELVRTWRGIKIYNDTTSTTPDALRVGLEALGGKKKNPARRQGGIILIMGGADKKLDMSQAIKSVRRYCKAVILLPGTGTDKLKSYKLKAKSLMVANLREAITIASELARSGDSIILSPGFASFGPPPGGFKNEFDRGEKFNWLVKNLV